MYNYLDSELYDLSREKLDQEFSLVYEALTVY